MKTYQHFATVLAGFLGPDTAVRLTHLHLAFTPDDV
jgi:hypothetical protein